MNATKKALLKVLGKERRGKAICVLGSGRCGTSMIMRAIYFSGVNIGSDFIKANDTNPKGFWENKKVVDIQKKINAEMNWKRPFPQEWHHKKAMQPYKKELKNLAKEQFANQDLWAWKDPRSCECIDMWQEIFKELRLSAGYIIMVRNPVDVAASFKKAYNRKEKTMMNLWQIRTLLSLKETYGEARTVIDYNDFLENSLKRLRETADILDLPWPQDESRLKNQLDEFVDPDLRHRQAGFEELAYHKDVDEEMKALYHLCLEAAHSRDILQLPSFQSRVERMYESFMAKKKMKA